MGLLDRFRGNSEGESGSGSEKPSFDYEAELTKVYAENREIHTPEQATERVQLEAQVAQGLADIVATTIGDADAHAFADKANKHLVEATTSSERYKDGSPETRAAAEAVVGAIGKAVTKEKGEPTPLRPVIQDGGESKGVNNEQLLKAIELVGEFGTFGGDTRGADRNLGDLRSMVGDAHRKVKEGGESLTMTFNLGILDTAIEFNCYVGYVGNEVRIGYTFSVVPLVDQLDRRTKRASRSS